MDYEDLRTILANLEILKGKQPDVENKLISFIWDQYFIPMFVNEVAEFNSRH